MEEIDENSLEYARKFKKNLRFDVADIVYLRSDIKKKCAMTIEKILIFNDNADDYVCIWSTSQKEIKRECFPDKTLFQ